MAHTMDIAFDNMEPSAAVEAKVVEKAEKLAKLFERLSYIRTTISAPNRLPHKPKTYQVKIVLGIPGRADLVISNDHDAAHDHTDVNLAVRDAFAAARRQLEEAAERLRGEVKTHAQHQAE